MQGCFAPKDKQIGSTLKNSGEICYQVGTVLFYGKDRAAHSVTSTKAYVPIMACIDVCEEHSCSDGPCLFHYSL